jgi:hypothetical protein
MRTVDDRDHDAFKACADERAKYAKKKKPTIMITKKQ